MAKGESKFTFGDKQKKSFSFEPFSARDCDLKLVGDSIEVRKSQRTNPSFSRVACAFVALGTAKEEGGKDRRVFHDFYLRLKPDKNGVQTPLRSDQLKGFADATGQQPAFDEVKQNNENILSPQQVVAWLKSLDGEVVRGHVRIKAGTAEFPEARNVISEFYDAEESSEDEDENDEDESEESDEETDDGDDDEESEDEDESEDDDDDDSDEDELAAALAKKKAKKKLKKGKGKK